MLQVKITKLLHLCFLIPFLLATIFGLYLFLEGVVNDEIYKIYKAFFFICRCDLHFYSGSKPEVSVLFCLLQEEVVMWVLSNSKYM